MSTIIHSTAVIDKGADIGPNCIIGPFCHIGKNVKIGSGNNLHSHVSLTGSTTIGTNNVFFPHACIGGCSEDLKYKTGTVTHVSIGNDNVFREHFTVNSATSDGASTCIADNNLFLSHSHVGHDCSIGSHIILGCGSKLAGHVFVDDFVTISGMTGVVQFVRLGKYSFVGACNKVVKDILPFMIADGNPSVIRVINRVGLERRGFSPLRIRTIRNVMRHLLVSNLALKFSIETLTKVQLEESDVKDIAVFISDSKIGISKFQSDIRLHIK